MYSDNSGRYPSAWQTVSSSYPNAAVTLNVGSWTPDLPPASSPTTSRPAARAWPRPAGPARTGYSSITVQTGRVGSDGQVVITGNLTCPTTTPPVGTMNSWTFTTHCQATDEVHVETTRIRAVINGTGGYLPSTELDSPWQTVGNPTPTRP